MKLVRQTCTLMDSDDTMYVEHNAELKALCNKFSIQIIQENTSKEAYQNIVSSHVVLDNRKVARRYK